MAKPYQYNDVGAAYAERFNLNSTPLGFDQTVEKVKKAIESYNEMRPHLSCNYLTPNEAHLQLSPMPKRWKNYNKYFVRKN